MLKPKQISQSIVWQDSGRRGDPCSESGPEVPFGFHTLAAICRRSRLRCCRPCLHSLSFERCGPSNRPRLLCDVGVDYATDANSKVRRVRPSETLSCYLARAIGSPVRNTSRGQSSICKHQSALSMNCARASGDGAGEPQRSSRTANGIVVQSDFGRNHRRAWAGLYSVSRRGVSKCDLQTMVGEHS